MPDEPATLPLLRRFPALAQLPRASLGAFPSRVERLRVGGAELWLKRDDLDAPMGGGNKVRSLEFLLGGVRAGDTVITLGGEGSTHVLATAVHASRLGARTVAVRWHHEMHDTARIVAQRAAERCARVITVRGGVAAALPLALAMHGVHRRTRWVPIGGSSPLGALGHVNAALELAAQVDAGELPEPSRIIVPLGSGGTAAGLALGLAIAGLRSVVTGVRVAPRIATNRWRTLRLAARTARLVERLCGQALPDAGPRLLVDHDWYGGAYGRPLARGSVAAATLREAGGPVVEATYGAKALAAALAAARAGDAGGPVLFWMTFDARLLD